MEGGDPKMSNLNPNVGAAEPVPTATMGSHQKQHRTGRTTSVGNTMVEENKQDRAILALQVAAVSCFMENVRSTQASCLTLCNTCREYVPVQRLRMASGVPSSILALAYPGLQKAVTGAMSRVIPIREALRIFWVFDDSFKPQRIAETDGKAGHIRDSELDIGSNLDMSKIQWPNGTKEIALCSFNRPIESVAWPKALETLWFADPTDSYLPIGRFLDMFTMRIDVASFPSNLREIFLGDRFNKSIEGVAWPRGLERLSLPGFNRSIRHVQWPPQLRSLEFVSPSNIRLWAVGGTDQEFMTGYDRDSRTGKRYFNQPLGTTLPPSLESLWLPYEFDQPLDSVAWPSGLATLGLAFDLSHYQVGAEPAPFVIGYQAVRAIMWPSNLQALFLFNNSLLPISYPKGTKMAVLASIETCSEESHSDRRFRFPIDEW